MGALSLTVVHSESHRVRPHLAISIVQNEVDIIAKNRHRKPKRRRTDTLIQLQSHLELCADYSSTRTSRLIHHALGLHRVVGHCRAISSVDE